MVLFNYSTKELTAKVVYYGPGLCGKTTNLQWIHEKLPIKNKGKMLSLATETDRTLFFDFLPIELGSIRGMKTRIQLYTVPGQVFYNATRRMVLKGADCVVFVCDSQEAMLEANLESMENLRQNLEANEIDPDEIPTVLQYNKRDLPNALPLEILNERLNPRGTPFYEAVALKGQGVEETLKGVTGLVFRSLASKYGGGEAGTNPPPATTTAPRVTPAVAVPAAPKPAPSPRPAPPAEPAPPPPVARTEGRPTGSSTLPPLNIAGPPPADDLLDSLELRPTTESTEGAEPLLEVELEEPAEDIETLSLEEEPLELPPAPPVAPRPEPVRDDPRSTLVRGAAEAEDLRRRISRPVQPEMELEEFAEEEIEEINLDNTGPFPAGAPMQPTETVAVSEKDRLKAALVPPPRGTPVAARTTPPPAPPAPDTARVPTLATPPVSVRLSPDAGETHVSIPVEVTLADGEAHVTIHLRLALNLKLH